MPKAFSMPYRTYTLSITVVNASVVMITATATISGPSVGASGFAVLKVQPIVPIWWPTADLAWRKGRATFAWRCGVGNPSSLGYSASLDGKDSYSQNRGREKKKKPLEVSRNSRTTSGDNASPCQSSLRPTISLSLSRTFTSTSFVARPRGEWVPAKLIYLARDCGQQV